MDGGSGSLPAEIAAVLLGAKGHVNLSHIRALRVQDCFASTADLRRTMYSEDSRGNQMNAQPGGWYPDPTDASQLRYWSGSAWTELRSPRHPTSAPAWSPPPPPPVATGKWYFVVTIATVGLLAAVPFFHAASRLDRPHLRKVGAGMAAGGLLGYALLAASPTDTTGQSTGWLSNVAVLILLTVMVVATLLLIGLRREVYNPAAIALPPNGNQGAMASVEESRRKRNEARKLAAKDPMMARELGIGRPESKTGYDDGGLLELNLATAEQLTEVCGLPRDLAQEVVSSRAALGRFIHVEDAVVYGQIGEEYAPLVRDRAIVIADR